MPGSEAQYSYSFEVAFSNHVSSQDGSSWLCVPFAAGVVPTFEYTLSSFTGTLTLGPVPDQASLGNVVYSGPVLVPGTLPLEVVFMCATVCFGYVLYFVLCALCIVACAWLCELCNVHGCVHCALCNVHGCVHCVWLLVHGCAHCAMCMVVYTVYGC